MANTIKSGFLFFLFKISLSFPQLTKSLIHLIIDITVQHGVNIDTKNSVKLACKLVFVSIFTSEEPLMLLV